MIGVSLLASARFGLLAGFFDDDFHAVGLLVVGLLSVGLPVAGSQLLVALVGAGLSVDALASCCGVRYGVGSGFLLRCACCFGVRWAW